MINRRFDRRLSLSARYFLGWARSDTDGAETPWGFLDPAPAVRDALVPRNLGEAPGFFSVNLRISKTTPLVLSLSRMARFVAW